MMQPPSSVRSGGIYRAQADINVTPLVDVMLVLLIIFMVTAPMLASGLHVTLPQAKAAEKLDQKRPIVLTFAKDGHVSLDDRSLSLDEVVDAVRAKLAGDLSQPIHLRADKQASYGDVVGLMDVLASHGMTHIAVLTGPASEPPASRNAAPALPDAKP